MELFIKIAQFLLSLSLIVLVHELGHFLAARIFRIRVDRFYLFFHPWGIKLWHKKIGHTEYGVGCLPLGGYVKIAGMIDESTDPEELSRPAQPDEFRTHPAWQRLIVMVAGVGMNLLFAVAIYCGISYRWGDTYLPVEEARWGYVFNEAGHTMGFCDGDRILAIDGRPVEEVDAVVGTLFLADDDRRVAVERAGQRVEWSIPLEELIRTRRDREALATFFTLRLPFVVDSVVSVPARNAGLLAGDRLIALNDIPARYLDEYRTLLPRFREESVSLTVERDTAGRTVQRELWVHLGATGQLGVSIAMPFSIARRHYTLWQSVPAGLKRTGAMISGYWEQLRMIFSPRSRMYEELGGFLSIGSIFSSTWEWQDFWLKTAFLSIILAIMNILPIPLLDGGHVLFLLWEVVTGRRPSDRFLVRAQTVGLIFLLVLLLYANGNDIYRFFIRPAP